MFRWNEFIQWLRDHITWLGSDEPSEETSNGLAIAISVVLSVLFWFTLEMQEIYTIALELPTQIIQLPEGESLAEKPPSEVRVQVRGEGWQLLQLYYKRQPVLLDASNNEIDMREALRLSGLTAGVAAVTGVRPETVEIETGPQTNRRVPIELRADIRTSRLYDIIGRPRLKPDTVVISGAASLVQSISRWPTDSIIKENVQSDLTLTVPLADTLGPLISKSIEETTVKVNVALFTEGIREVPVEVTNVPPSVGEVRLEPSKVRVIYRVPLDQYEQARDAEGFSATVPYAAIRQDTTGTVSPRVETPETVVIRDVRVEPNKLQYFTVIPSD